MKKLKLYNDRPIRLCDRDKADGMILTGMCILVIGVLFLCTMFPIVKGSRNTGTAATSEPACIAVAMTGNIRELAVGVEPVGDYREYRIYADKSYTIADRRLLSEGQWDDGTVKGIQMSSWDELAEVLDGEVMMQQGDVATLSVEQFIDYAKDMYP